MLRLQHEYHLKLCALPSFDSPCLAQIHFQVTKTLVDDLIHNGHIIKVTRGASTAIFCAAEDNDLTAVVLDSPFTNLRAVALELGNEAIACTHSPRELSSCLAFLGFCWFMGKISEMAPNGARSFFLLI